MKRTLLTLLILLTLGCARVVSVKPLRTWTAESVEECVKGQSCYPVTISSGDSTTIHWQCSDVRGRQRQMVTWTDYREDYSDGRTSVVTRAVKRVPLEVCR